MGKNKYNRISNSQICNFNTYEMYKRQLLSLAANVFVFTGISTFVNMSYVNNKLVSTGSIAWFYDDMLECVIALPYIVRGSLDLYGRPRNITAIGYTNGYREDLKYGEFVVMYDNSGLYAIYLDLIQYAERLALAQRTVDINIKQQRTPRYWKTTDNKRKSLEDTLKKVEDGDDTIVTYEDLNLDDTTMTLAPAPYTADKVEENKEKIWAEALRVMGIANLTQQKRERLIKDEVMSTQGGTIASRFSRYEPRKRAVEEINEKFAGKKGFTPITVEYYDGDPSTIGKNEDEEVLDDVSDI